MRVVLDTNVLVRATQSASGPAREVLGLLFTGAHEVVISRHILTELVRVLQYPRVAALHRLTLDECRDFVAFVDQLAEHIEISAGLPTDRISSDPDDDPVIATELAGKADVLCTLDRHLNHKDVRSHCDAHGCRVLTDVVLLTLLREAEPE